MTAGLPRSCHGATASTPFFVPTSFRSARHVCAPPCAGRGFFHDGWFGPGKL
jgi:hypothetical protein